MAGRHIQIGEAADRAGLSIRTIRHYEDAGLVVPSARSEGGFRLYTEPDLDRLRVIKRMKPLGFTLEEMRDLLHILDGLATAGGDQRTALQDRLAMFHTAAQERVRALREQLATAEVFAQQIQDHIEVHTADPDPVASDGASSVLPLRTTTTGRSAPAGIVRLVEPSS